MADWQLQFAQTRPITVDECVGALVAMGGAVTTTIGPYSGNPRDFYTREVTLAAELAGGVRIEARLQQVAWAPHDPAPLVADGITVVLRAASAPFARKRDTWHQLRDVFAAMGCADRTIERKPTAIAAEAAAAGDTETAAELRAGIAVIRKREAAERRRRNKLRALAEARAAAPVSAPAPTTPRPRSRSRSRSRSMPAPVPAVTHAPVEWPALRMTLEDGVLAIAAGILDGVALRRLVERGAYRSATKVVFSHAALGDDGVAFLARSGAFPAVTELRLGGTGMTDRGANAFAHDANGFDRLETIDLGDVPAAAGGLGVSDVGVERIARSTRLPALRTIVRRYEHRQPGDYRDDTETLAIARADGRVVEAIVEHSIWP